MYDDKRNPMKLEEVTTDTLFEVDYTFKPGSYYKAKGGYRPTIGYVSAIKPCGCTGPHLGSLQTVPPPQRKDTFNAPADFDAGVRGYVLEQETKDRVALYLHGQRLFGKRWFGGDRNRFYRKLAWDHYHRKIERANAPAKPDGRLHTTAEDAMTRIPSASCKLWAVYPEKPYRSNGKNTKPVGYVWGKDAAALALRNWWARKNGAKDKTYVAVPHGTARPTTRELRSPSRPRIEQSAHHMFGGGN